MAYMPQRGFGGYQRTGNWTWEFYPPPYDFLAPRNSAPVPPFVYPGRGVGGCGCGGSCGGACHGGLGLFESGLDLSQWGLGEWAAVGLGVYLLSSVFGDVKRVGGHVRKARRMSESKARRKERLEKELKEL
jgi:hypothetical protein